MGRYSLHLGDCFSWMDNRPKDSIHAIVTDPPYGLKEYTSEEKEKLLSSVQNVVTKISVSLAEKILEREFKDADQKRIMTTIEKDLPALLK